MWYQWVVSNPPKDPADKRSVRITILVTGTDRLRLEAAAKADHVFSLSHWIASAALKRADELGIPADPPAPSKKKPAKK